MKLKSAREAALVAVVALLAARTVAQEPPLAAVMARARAYAVEYQRQLSGVVAEEVYVQSERLSMFGNSGPSREIKSDVLLVRPSGADRYVLLRDVFEVDGKPVRDREERLTQLFLEGSPSAEAQMGRIITESARFNIGAITRTLNVPTLALIALAPPRGSRFEFIRTTERIPATLAARGAAADPSRRSFSVSPDAWVLGFRELTSPTVIRTTTDADQPISGRFWIEPATGRVLMTELVAENRAVVLVIDVAYDAEPRSGLLVPIAMRERYEGGRTTIEGSAVYSRHRRFEVQTDEKLKSDP